MSNENAKKLLLKLKFFSEVGVGAEKENATDKLNKALEKHGLTLEDLENDKKEIRTFKIKDRGDCLSILVQCIYDVCPNSKIEQCSRRLEIYCKLNSSEYVEASEKYKHYYNHWLKEKKQFLTAFVIKNKIGLLDKKEGRELSPDEIAALAQKMISIDDNKFIDGNTKQLN